jgi:hypothetical protein
MKVPTFYWLSTEGERQGNFGDILTPFILDYFNIKYNYTKTWKDPNVSVDAICVGSIIERAAYEGTVVLGSGIMTMHKRINPGADYRLVRGPLSRKRILDAGGECPESYGDPGFLLPLIFEENKKEHDVGFVPHLINYDKIKKQYPNEFVINLKTDNPADIVKQITKCRSIVSSSLHGIITAHAYGIPAAWAESAELLNNYSDTKFIDYYQSINKEPNLSTFNDPIFDSGFLNINNIIKIFKDYSYEISH